METTHVIVRAVPAKHGDAPAAKLQDERPRPMSAIVVERVRVRLIKEPDIIWRKLTIDVDFESAGRGVGPNVDALVLRLLRRALGVRHWAVQRPSPVG